MRRDGDRPTDDRHATLALWALLALLGGGWFAPRLAEPGPVPAAAALAGGAVLALAATGTARRRRGPPPPEGATALTAGLLAAVAVVLVTAGAGALRMAASERGPLVDVARARGGVDVTATVAAEPRVEGGRWWTIVRVDRVDGRRTRERALLRSGGAAPPEPPVLGSRWTGAVRAIPLERDGFGLHLRRQYTTVAIRPRRWERAGDPGVLAATSEAVRERVRAASSRLLPPAHAGLATGLVTGDTRLLPEADQDAMRATGLTHLVAVSGSNVAIVLAGTVVLLRPLPVGARGRRGVLVVAVAWFAFLTRWEPSVVRASVMAALVLLAVGRGHLRDAGYALAGAILLVCLFDPGAAASPGLLLSAAATAGVLLIAPHVRRRLTWLPDRAAALLAAALGAQLAVAPLLLATFGDVPLVAVPANVVAVPAAAIASAIAAAAALAATFAPGAAAALFALARPALAIVLAVARALDGHGVAVETARPASVVAAVAGGWWLLARGPRTRRRAGLVAAGCLVAAVLPLAAPLAPVRELTVTAIDVGQGDAILVESPGATLLVDGGGDDRAHRWLGPARRRLDLVVLSHPHADHADGLPAAVRSRDVGAVWLPAGDRLLDSVAAVVARAEEDGIALHHPVAGDVARVGDLRVEVLSPPAPAREDDGVNDRSLVLRVSWSGRVALLAGDVERDGQRALLRDPGRLEAGVLKVPHHGADTNAEGFLAAVAPRTAVISAGRDNPYGHPDPDVVARLAEVGADVRRTDLEGTVRVTVPATGGEFSARPSSSPTTGATQSSRLRSHHDRRGRRAPGDRRRRSPSPPRRGRPPARLPRGHPGPRGRLRRCRRRRGPP